MDKPVFCYKNMGDLFYALNNPKEIYANVPELSKDDFWIFENFDFKDSLINNAKFSLLFLPKERAVLSAELETRVNVSDFVKRYDGLLSDLNVASDDGNGQVDLLLDYTVSGLPVNRGFKKKNLVNSLDCGFGKFNLAIGFMYDFAGCGNRRCKRYDVDFSQIRG